MALPGPETGRLMAAGAEGVGVDGPSTAVGAVCCGPGWPTELTGLALAAGRDGTGLAALGDWPG